nr:MAG TPA: hypothetical protein [Microviridae sp.]
MRIFLSSARPDVVRVFFFLCFTSCRSIIACAT